LVIVSVLHIHGLTLFPPRPSAFQRRESGALTRVDERGYRDANELRSVS